MRRSRFRTVAVTAGAVTLVAGCGSGGRAMVAPKPGATAPARVTSTTYAQSAYRPAPLLSSSAFKPGGELPDEFQCGSTAPPSLSWTAIPKGTKEIVLAMYALKPSADLHWMVVGIPPTVSTFTGTVPAGAKEMPNSFGGIGWHPPCAPEDQTQSFQFEVLALPAAAQITEGQTPTGVLQQLETQAGDGRGFLPTTINPAGTTTLPDFGGGTGGGTGVGSVPGSVPPGAEAGTDTGTGIGTEGSAPSSLAPLGTDAPALP